MSTGNPTHRHDELHRGQVPTDQLADGTATSGYGPISNGDGSVTWGPVGGDTSNFVTKNEGGQDTIFPHGSMGSTETFDPTDGNVHTGTLDANCTFTLNAPVGTGAATLELYLAQGGSGSYTVTWPGSVVWPGGTAPTLSTTVGNIDRIILETLDGGTTWYGVMVGGTSGPDLSAIDFLVGTASGDLTSEIVVGTTPGGELGGTWASPTVDATHAGSTHIALSSATPLVESGAGSAGSGTAASKDDHVHPAATSSGTSAPSHIHVVGETHLSDGSTTTYTLDGAFEPGSVEAFNTTTLAYLTVTETQPDQATVSAAGTTGDKITFSYAGSLA